MKVLIPGEAEKTGSLTVGQALAKDHEVTAPVLHAVTEEIVK